MQGTHCISGSGIGVVVSTGDKTVFGRIAKMTNEPQNRSRHLGKRSPQLCPFNLLNHVLHDHFGYHCVVSTIITRSSIFMLSYVGLLICEQATQTGLMSPP